MTFDPKLGMDPDWYPVHWLRKAAQRSYATPAHRTDPLFTPRVQAGYQLFKELTQEERATILAWFCLRCFRYVGPGDSCHCEERV